MGWTHTHTHKTNHQDFLPSASHPPFGHPHILPEDHLQETSKFVEVCPSTHGVFFSQGEGKGFFGWMVNGTPRKSRDSLKKAYYILVSWQSCKGEPGHSIQKWKSLILWWWIKITACEHLLKPSNKIKKSHLKVTDLRVDPAWFLWIPTYAAESPLYNSQSPTVFVATTHLTLKTNTASWKLTKQNTSDDTLPDSPPQTNRQNLRTLTPSLEVRTPLYS